jgi:hypothetical protein
MPGTAEFAQVEARIAALTDAELVEMADHPADYEPWALELGHSELARRRLSSAGVEQLRAGNAADAESIAPPNPAELIFGHLVLYPLLLIGVVAFPAYFFLGRVYERRGDPKTARRFRFVGWLILSMYCCAALTLLLWKLGVVS